MLIRHYEEYVLVGGHDDTKKGKFTLNLTWKNNENNIEMNNIGCLIMSP